MNINNWTKLISDTSVWELKKHCRCLLHGINCDLKKFYYKSQYYNKLECLSVSATYTLVRDDASQYCAYLDVSDQGILKGEVPLYHWPPVWLVWNQLYDNWQFLFLFQNRLIQNSQTECQQYSDTSPFSILRPDNNKPSSLLIVASPLSVPQ